MKQITFEQAMARIARGEDVTLYKPLTRIDTLQIAVIRDLLDKGAFFAIDGEDEVKNFPTVHEPKVEKPKADEPKAKAAKKQKYENQFTKPRKDYGKMQALRNAGWKIKDIAGECRCSVSAVYAHTVKPDAGSH